MTIINFSDYSNKNNCPSLSGRKIYRRESFFVRVAKKFHLKEIGIAVIAFIYVYLLTILCFACCQY